MDVLDRIVISGTVTDSDPLSRSDEAPTEFTYEVRSVGDNDPATWLLGALGRLMREEQTGPSGRV